MASAEDEWDDPKSRASQEPVADEDDGGEDAEGGPKILTKKEKEKLKKEKEKAKKKAQAAAKKATQAEEEPEKPAEPSKDEEDNDEDEEGGKELSAAAKKKKKKKAAQAAKKAAAVAESESEEEKPEPVATGKKAKGKLGALKAAMEERRRLEEEAQRKLEEEKARIAEELRKEEEEEKRKEEEKQRRKEKEKAKKEALRKEGKLLTKKQKEDQKRAEIRRQALLASGAQIEGLAGASSGEPSKPKRVVYGNKKKGPSKQAQTATPTDSPATTNVSLPASRASSPPASVAAEDKEDAWDASSEDEKPKEEAAAPSADVKEDWDASTDEEAPAKKEEQKKEAKAAATPATKPPPAQPSKAQQLALQRKEEARKRREKAHEEAMANRNKDDLRSPICCILGHVDTGKTKLLDKIRQTNVQEGEAGGITQQIGATYFPVDAIKTKTEVLNKDGKQEYKIPGLLVIDTPGHESFTNLRSRGSSLCNIAILVVDIMHGLEAQTLESLRLLRDRKTPFIVALNKIDRLYGWDATPNGAFRESLAKQPTATQREFADRLAKAKLAFAEEGLNAELYYENKSFARNVSLVPTSAITGEGIPDMIMLLVNLTQQRMSDRLMYLSELECTVLEVKVVEGLGTTIDVVLSNGILRESDRIVVCGLNGPIVTQVRALLTPQPLRELRVKSAYVHHKEVKAALGVKITAPDLEKAIAGSRLLVVGPDDDEDDLRDEVMSDLTSLLNSIDKSGRGVCVQASTLGSLEALLDFLKSSKIPVSGINIGPVHKKDVMRCATMLEKAKELAVILCFDVDIDRDAQRMADEMGIKLFRADIIYHLFDAFTAYNQEIVEAKRKDAAPQAVWPCRLKIIAAFAKRDPIILGVDILDGTLRVGTPLAVVKVDKETGKKEIHELGKITSLEINHKTFDIVKKNQAGGGVAVKIEHAVYQSAKMFGRHFDDKDEIYSQISRASIDVLKTTFKQDVSNEEWLLIKALKPKFNVQ
ncbi:P-loop containing nucleoside triphosphate hydrolase protein [Flagelloscypha sp. PMI_526]|nr:P-loop containing nucleoside triphosphate hydrolase protein [Flagelloscypha sp. PMI_526]